MRRFKQQAHTRSCILFYVPAQAWRDAGSRGNDETPSWPQCGQLGFNGLKLASRTLKLSPKWEPCSGDGWGCHLLHISMGPRSLAPCDCGRTAAWQGPQLAGLLVMLACSCLLPRRILPKGDSRCDSVIPIILAGPL